ncbi:MAG: EF-P lysine aminoacylase GenX [bacterium]
MSEWQPSADLGALHARARMLTQIREFFLQREVLEVQVPVLGSHTVTDPDVEAIAVPGYGFLQTSPEYYLKRLLAAGVPSCYQLAPAFRDDEQGRLHNPEFYLLEWYQLGYDARQLRAEVAQLCDLVLGPAAYQQVAYKDLVADLNAPREQLDLAFARACERLKPGRFFIVDYPADQAALAKVSRTDPSVAERFELVIDGVEIANGYHELTDPAEHRRRFAQDNQIRHTRGLVARALDEPFLSALTSGLPECAGVALGVDRLLMLSLGADSLDEVMAFRVR